MPITPGRSGGAAWPNTAADRFVSPDGKISLASWSVLVEPGTDLLAWIAAYCPLNTSPCTGIRIAIPVVADDKLHVSGVLIPFDDNVQAFFLHVDRIYVVAAWHPESDPGLAQFGGGRRLLEAMSASMCFTCASPGGVHPAARLSADARKSVGERLRASLRELGGFPGVVVLGGQPRVRVAVVVEVRAAFVSWSGWKVSTMTASSSVASLPIDASTVPGCGPCGMPAGCSVNEAISTPRRLMKLPAT